MHEHKQSMYTMNLGCGSGWSLPGSGSLRNKLDSDPTLEKQPGSRSFLILHKKGFLYFFFSVLIDKSILYYNFVQ